MNEMWSIQTRECCSSADENEAPTQAPDAARELQRCTPRPRRLTHPAAGRRLRPREGNRARRAVGTSPGGAGAGAARREHFVVWGAETHTPKEPLFFRFHISVGKIWKQPECPSADDRMTKMWYVHTVEYYSAMKKGELLTSAVMRSDPEATVLTRQSKSDGEGQMSQAHL